MADVLEGIVVIEDAGSIAAAFCGMILADLGARVIKLQHDHGAAPAQVDRGKQSVVLATDTAAGRSALGRLARGADVYITDKPAAPDPDLTHAAQVWCAVTPHGCTGPYRERPASEGTLQAISGLMSITGEKGKPPMRVGLSVTQVYGGLHAALAVLAALYERMESGQGQSIDLSCADAHISLWGTNAAQFLANGRFPGPFGNENPNRCPAKTFAAEDGRYFHIMGANDAHWPLFCQVMGWEDLITDPDFNTNRKRVANREEVNRRIAESVLTQPRQAWLDRFEAAGVPAAAVNTLAEIVTDPHYQARQMFVRADGRVEVGSPLRMSATPGRPHGPVPRLGEHTQAVLARAGLEPAEIEGLIGTGVAGGY